MRRKLVKQGAATLMVSLPSKWAKENGLIKGSEVEVEAVDNNLVISSKEIDTKLETEVQLTNLSESSIRTIITNTYRGGFDKIKVYFEEEKQFDILSEIIKNNLIGFEIIKKESNYCIVENITEPSEDQFNNILQKIFLNINSLFEVTKKRFNKEKYIEDYNEIEDRIKKYDGFCRRVIFKKKIFSHESEFLWTFLHLLIHAQREIYLLNKALDNHKILVKNYDYLDKVKELYDLLIEAYSEKSLEKIEKIHELEKKYIYSDFYNLIQKNSKENIILYHLASALRKFYLASSPFIGAGLGRDT